MKFYSRLIYSLFHFFLCFSLSAQNYQLGNTLHEDGWYKFGRLSLIQQGADAHIQIFGGLGYNADYNQLNASSIHFRTSNMTSNINSFYGMASYYNEGMYKLIDRLTIVQIDQSTWDFYAVFSRYTGDNSFVKFSSFAGTWSPLFEKGGPSDDMIKLQVIERQLNNSDHIFLGNVGIGSDNFSEKLTVAGNILANGNIRAKEIKVEATNWPDYVFKPEYRLMPLKEVEKHIQLHGHLPDIPKAEQIEQDGLSVSEMNQLMMKKIEELTLHLIEKDKEIKELRLLREEVRRLEKVIADKK